jgi:hypothetical protein
MLICKHRVNTIEALLATPRNLGIEVDIRSKGENLHIAHDAFTDGVPLIDWLANYSHAFLVANVKEEGLEERLRELFTAYSIDQWAFLDQSFPFLVRELRGGHRKTMVRISEYESIQTPLNLATKPEWIWLDSFTGSYPSAQELVRLKQAGYKFMAVSPELQGREPAEEISRIKDLFDNAGLTLDAVCTKLPESWH